MTLRDMVYNQDAKAVLAMLEVAVPEQYSMVLIRVEALKKDIEKLLAEKEFV
jgi:hypothetical protein